MAREEVYQILPKLQSLGLIEKILERPAKFKAIPLDECVSNLIEKRKNTTRELEIKSKELIKNYEEINSTQKNYPHDTKFVFVPSQQALVRKLKTSINGAQNSIWVSTTCKRLTYACDHFYEVLQKAWDRGVKGRAIINGPKENQLDMIKKCWISPWAEIRYVPKVPRTVIAMYDKREVFVFTNPEADLRESPALWSNYSSIVSMSVDFFEILWSTSMETPQYYLDKI
jgi:sugar-specific transcriptional regulator TrmB